MILLKIIALITGGLFHPFLACMMQVQEGSGEMAVGWVFAGFIYLGVMSWVISALISWAIQVIKAFFDLE